MKDPRVETTLGALQEQDAFLENLEATISEVHESVVRIREVRGQVETFLERAETTAGAEEVVETGEALVTGLTEVEEALIQKRTVDGQTVINFPSRLNHHLIYLRGAVDGSEVGLIQGAQQRFDDLMVDWNREKAKLDALMGAELDAFNALVIEKGIPLVSPSPTSE